MQWPKNKPRDPVALGIKIMVDAVAMQKFWQYIDIAKGEVSAFGLVEEIRDAGTGIITSLLVTDFFLVKQMCSADETTMDALAVAQLMLDLENQGVDSRKLRCWIHSHAQMSVFWSSTDDDCINGLANGEYLVSIVVNKKRDTMCRLDQYHPCHMYITVVWEVRYPLVDGLAEACLVEFKAKVIETNGIFGTAKSVTVDLLHDLRDARDRGALTVDELNDEYDWLGIERDDLEEQAY